MAERRSALEPVKQVFSADEEYRVFSNGGGELPDFIFATSRDEHDPNCIFPRLRWGGMFVYAAESPNEVKAIARRFAEFGFVLEKPDQTLADGWKFWPLIRRHVHYFGARKVLHVPKGGLTDRFTFEVELSVCHEVHKGKHVVTKRIPSVEWVANRLRRRNPDFLENEVQKRAQGLIRNILPIFLTREVALMRRLQEYLPPNYRRRVPHCVHFEQDERGYVNLLQVNWLRNGGEPISQLEFAIQSMDLLAAVHHKAGVAHLDLRMDNMVITPDGVGFIDFGNSVHDAEDIAGSPTLSRIFSELMRTTTVHKTMHRAIQTGHVTAPYFIDGLYKPTKPVDLFYLVFQFNTPHDNPDLKDLILYEANSKEDYELSRLARRLFAPESLDPGKTYTAQHVYNALRTIQKRLE